MTEQDLGLHLIARYLLTPDKCLPTVDHMVRKLCYAYNITRVNNLSIDFGCYIPYNLSICCNCKYFHGDRSKYKYDKISCCTCSNCSNIDSINYHTAVKSEQINTDITFISYEYKLKLQEILWQTYLRRLL
jgi:hypothetical protein